MRANKVPKYWSELCEALGCPQVMEEPLVMQLTNQQIFENLLISMFQTIEKKPAIELTADEENVIRYACGYVVRKLHQSF